MQKLAAGLIVGIGAAAVVLALDAISATSSGPSTLHPLQTIEWKTYDWRLAATAQPSTARKDIALVEIDEYSLRNLEPNAGRWPWPRAVHSMLIDYLARGPARVVAYDVDFAEPDSRSGFLFGGTTWSGAESDQAFIDSIRTAGNVLLLCDATYEGEATGKPPALADAGLQLQSPFVVDRKILFPPFAPLGTSAAGLGHNLFVLDADGPLRHTIPFVRSAQGVLPSLGLAAALRVAGIPAERITIEGEQLRIGERTMPLSLRRVRTEDGVSSYLWGLVDFRGPALLDDLKSRPYASYSFFDLLYSEEQLLAGTKPKVDPAIFKDKLVFVGVTATGLHDVFETPFAGGKMPGIQVYAAVADDVLSGRFVEPSSTAVRVATVFSAAIVVGSFATMFAAWWATGATAVLMIAFLWLSLRLFATGYWLNVSEPLLASSFALFGGVAYQYFVEGREKRKMRRLFGQYVSKDVCEQLVAHPELARLGGQRREMTVLFSDIRGFTTVTERGKPEDVVGMLNEYFTRMVDIVFRYHGTLDKFVGDMVMALFGAPLDDPEHADHALQAALEMVTELAALNQRWAAEGRFAKLDLGIGINTGAMIAGNIGSEAIMSYTVIGDAVNLGARLESLNKEFKTRILISDATRRKLTGRYTLRNLGEVVVKGKTESVTVFEVIGHADAETASEATRERSAVGEVNV